MEKGEEVLTSIQTLQFCSSSGPHAYHSSADMLPFLTNLLSIVPILTVRTLCYSSNNKFSMGKHL
jgi:hypothetical protein